MDFTVLIAIKQVPVPLIYKGRKLELGYRLDLLVEDNPVPTAQLVTYLKLSAAKQGY